MERFYVEENEVGGHRVLDRRTRNVVTTTSFERDALRAASRLNGHADGAPADWFAYYRVAA